MKILAWINVIAAAILLYTLLKKHVSWNLDKTLYCYSIFSNESLWKMILFSANVNTFYNIYNKMVVFPAFPIISLTQVSSSWSHSSEHIMLTGTQLQCSLRSILKECFGLRSCHKDQICITHSPTIMVSIISSVFACSNPETWFEMEN
jgi:hypothetical protein